MAEIHLTIKTESEEILRFSHLDDDKDMYVTIEEVGHHKMAGIWIDKENIKSIIKHLEFQLKRCDG